MSQQEYRTHGGGLFCGEGNVHVGRSSTRVRAPPGGVSSISFGTTSNSTYGSSYSHQNNNSYQQDNNKYDNQSYNNQSYGNQSHSNQSHSNQSYGNQSYGNQSYGNQSYGNQSFGNQSLGNQTQTPVKGGDYASPLFCGEGNVHVGRRSTRVQAPPGGNSSISF